MNSVYSQMNISDEYVGTCQKFDDRAEDFPHSWYETWVRYQTLLDSLLADFVPRDATFEQIQLCCHVFFEKLAQEGTCFFEKIAQEGVGIHVLF